jgi:hypothetical protein
LAYFLIVTGSSFAAITNLPKTAQRHGNSPVTDASTCGRPIRIRAKPPEKEALCALRQRVAASHAAQHGQYAAAMASQHCRSAAIPV